MKLTFMGTGTSHGIPTIGCRCAVCRSDNPKNKRGRCGALLQINGKNWLIDTPTEFRLQALRENLTHVNAVLYTHAHSDHILGLDDLRVFTIDRPLSIYGNRETIRTIHRAFPYAFKPPKQAGGGFPCLTAHRVKKPFLIDGIPVTPLPVLHGKIPILGYRIGDLVYITDAAVIPEATYKLTAGCRCLVINALRYYPHPTHFSLAQAMLAAEKIGAERVFFTHICHNMEHEAVNRTLPSGTELAYDGLSVEIGFSS